MKNKAGGFRGLSNEWRAAISASPVHANRQ
jgi:hypothetical protein